MVKPLSGKIVVRVEKEKERMVNGIVVLPSDNTETKKTDIGTVVAIGDCVTDVHVGDRVVIGKFAGTCLTDDGDIVIQESDVEGILEVA